MAKSGRSEVILQRIVSQALVVEEKENGWLGESKVIPT
jgi:hypothetical protein